MSRKFSLKARFVSAVALAGAALSTLAPAQAHEYETFDSTVVIYNCSASVVQLPGAKDTDKALVMTNGHCIKPVFDRYMNRGEVVTNHSLWNAKSYFKDISFVGGSKPTEKLKGKLTDIVYATMDDTDLAILRTDKTYGQLKRSGVKVRPLSSVRPAAGTQIQIPSTYWRKAYSCNIDGFVPQLHEGSWLWRDAIRYTASDCYVQSGSSGSPIVDTSNGAVIGINNTANGGGEACTLGNPCEDDGYGNKNSITGRGYGTQTYNVPTCFNGSQLAMNKAGCQLPKK